MNQTNLDVYWDVHNAGDEAVYKSLRGAVYWPVFWSLFWSVCDDVNNPLNEAVARTVEWASWGRR